MKGLHRYPLRTFLTLSGLWLVFVLYLDVKYQRFPDVLLGGTEVLLFVYFLLSLAWLTIQGVRRLLAPSAHTVTDPTPLSTDAGLRGAAPRNRSQGRDRMFPRAGSSDRQSLGSDGL